MIPNNPTTHRLFYSISEFTVLTGLSRTRVFEELRVGRLRAKKCGKRTIIQASEVEAWVACLEDRKAG